MMQLTAGYGNRGEGHQKELLCFLRVQHKAAERHTADP